MQDILIINDDNMNVEFEKESIDIVFSDYIYEDTNFQWIEKYWEYVKPNKFFIAMTDFHSVFELGYFMKYSIGANLVNHIVWKNEWGNHPKDRMHQCFDDILVFSKGNHNVFNSDKIQVPKATVNKKLNPSGRQTKTSTAFWSDICLTTTSKERIKDLETGKLFKWQKPLALMQRIMDAYSNEGDFIIDNFMGTGVLAEWSLLNNRKYVGIEYDKNRFVATKNRLEKLGWKYEQ